MSRQIAPLFPRDGNKSKGFVENLVASLVVLFGISGLYCKLGSPQNGLGNIAYRVEFPFNYTFQNNVVCFDKDISINTVLVDNVGSVHQQPVIDKIPLVVGKTATYIAIGVKVVIELYINCLSNDFTGGQVDSIIGGFNAGGGSERDHCVGIPRFIAVLFIAGHGRYEQDHGKKVKRFHGFGF